MIELTSLFAVSAAALLTANTWHRVKNKTIRDWDLLFLFVVSLIAASLATVSFLHYAIGL